MKYRKNLRVDGDKIFSYGTCVATIDPVKREVLSPRWYSVTTSKHINHVADVLGLVVKKSESDELRKN